MGDVTTTMIPAVDPKLDELSDNGGETQTHALQANCPVLNAGRPSGCLGFGNLQLNEDQRGELRPADGDCDMGAYEVQLPPTAVTL